jgi:hypothetical protein
MDRMGHDSERAALIYLHGSDARQQAIADTLSQLARNELQQGKVAKPRPGRAEAIGHATGTATAQGFVALARNNGNMTADLVILICAPGRIRTRDPLLRRQLLYPAELQAPTERIVQYPGHTQATSPGQRP